MGMDNSDRGSMGARVSMVSSTSWWSQGDVGTIVFVGDDKTEKVLILGYSWWCRAKDYKVLRK